MAQLLNSGKADAATYKHNQLITYRDGFGRANKDKLQGMTGWIGLSNKRNALKWVWEASNAVAAFENWAPGEPNGHNGARCAAQWNSKHPGRWDDQNCDKKRHYFVCERGEGEQRKTAFTQKMLPPPPPPPPPAFYWLGVQTLTINPFLCIFLFSTFSQVRTLRCHAQTEPGTMSRRPPLATVFQQQRRPGTLPRVPVQPWEVNWSKFEVPRKTSLL